MNPSQDQYLLIVLISLAVPVVTLIVNCVFQLKLKNKELNYDKELFLYKEQLKTFCDFLEFLYSSQGNIYENYNDMFKTTFNKMYFYIPSCHWDKLDNLCSALASGNANEILIKSSELSKLMGVLLHEQSKRF